VVKYASTTLMIPRGGLLGAYRPLIQRKDRTQDPYFCIVINIVQDYIGVIQGLYRTRLAYTRL
jgi:hypothetical protein